MQRNLAERAGRWSAAHWKTATFGWLAFVAVAVVLGQALGTVKLSDAEQASGETARAEQALARSGLHGTPARRAGSQARCMSGTRTSRASSRVSKRGAAPAAGDRRALAPGRALRADLQRPPCGARRVRPARLADTAADRVQPVLERVAALRRGGPRLHRRRVRRRERGARTQQDGQRRLLPGREAVAADHVPGPAARLRRVRRRRRAGAAGVLGRARLARDRRAGEPPRSTPPTRPAR